VRFPQGKGRAQARRGGPKAAARSVPSSARSVRSQQLRWVCHPLPSPRGSAFLWASPVAWADREARAAPRLPAPLWALRNAAGQGREKSL